MATTRESMAALMAPAISKIVMGKTDTPRFYESVLNVDSSSRAYENSQGVTAFGMFQRKYEGQGVKFDDPRQTWAKTFFHLTWALGFRITREAIDDDQYKMLGKNMANKLGRSAVVTQEVLAAANFNNGFGDASNQPDGVPLFSPNHPLVGGGFYGNAPTTPVALSTTALQTAFTSLQLTVDDRGILQVYRPKTLVVPPALQYTAKTLLRSILLPGGSQNDINPIADEVEPFVWPYLLNPTAWFVLAEKTEIDIRWFNRQKVTMRDWDDPATDDACYKGTFRSSTGNEGWRGTYGSPGS